MIDPSRMNRVLDVTGEHVTSQAGITLHQLGEALAARRFAMENQGDVDRQTLAGAIATDASTTSTPGGCWASGSCGRRSR
jgi:L-gulono-1,4-lactone dehydrogenase